MDPLVNLGREIHPHILFNLEPVEFLPVMQVSLLWYEVAANELERMIFSKYAPKGEERGTYRSKYGIESAKQLFNRIKTFVECGDKTKTRSLICHFPFNPGFIVVVEIYPEKEVEEPTLSDLAPSITSTEEERQKWIQKVIEEKLSCLERAEVKACFVVMKKLSDEDSEEILKLPQKEQFFAHNPDEVSFSWGGHTISLFLSDQDKDKLLGYSNIKTYARKYIFRR